MTAPSNERMAPEATVIGPVPAAPLSARRTAPSLICVPPLYAEGNTALGSPKMSSPEPFLVRLLFVAFINSLTDQTVRELEPLMVQLPFAPSTTGQGMV